MALQMTQRLMPGEDEKRLKYYAAKQLGISENDITEFCILKKSLDARKKNDIHYSCTIKIACAHEDRLLLQCGDILKFEAAHITPPTPGKGVLQGRVIVIGAGPCGLFAALELAKLGYAPVVLERGKPVEQRAKDVEALFERGALDTESNVLFGEGGAGAFSDGKLTSRSKDARSDMVLSAFVECGAPPETAYLAKPHIGTDLLRGVISNLRKKIEALGGSFLYSTKAEELIIKNGALAGVKTSGGEIIAGACVLACGHSARDTYAMLLAKGIALIPKPFAAGVRIEHLQADINMRQYGDEKLARLLGAADYALTAKDAEGRGVYTFCMCPGGSVVCSASEENLLCVNGMSLHSRNGANANSAIVVQIAPEDCGSAPLDGLEFQRRLEKAAFKAGGGGYFAPVQTVGSFLYGKPDRFTRVTPSYTPGCKQADLRRVLPEFMAKGIACALPQFDRKLRGFAAESAVLTGVETRTSSPVRIVRGDDCQSASVKGLYPAGEGAGCAGGIVSAAIDGIKAAWSIIESYSPPEG